MRLSTSVVVAAILAAAASPADENRVISGIRPHLAVFNPYGECGIGPVAPWAGRLWWITYPPHHRTGSEDGLYSTDESFRLVRHPESVGGTHAARLIHRESRQLVIGPYAIDETGRVRAINVKAIPGRYTAWARHLTDPANRLLLFDMEGPVWEVDVHTLEGRRLFEKPVPGWHGKGAWTGQGRFVIANNGEHAAGRTPRADEFLCALPPPSPEDAGALAEWDGSTWRLIARRQFCEVAGHGGLAGANDDREPVWATGWDRRSVLLYVLDDGRWHRYRLPKASFTYDPRHGWFTEWPRIRPIGRDRWMMTMHGQMFDFPPTMSAARARGLRPIATHLRYIPDFCEWNGRLVLASDDCSIMQNPMVGKSQSNLWIGSPEELPTFGPPLGWGSVWLGDRVQAHVPSDPYLFAGYRRRCAHIAHNAGAPVEFRLEVDPSGDGRWQPLTNVVVDAAGYSSVIFPPDAPGEWIRAIASRDLPAGSVHFHYLPDRAHSPDPAFFAALAPAARAGRGCSWSRAILRPGDGVLHVLLETIDSDGRTAQTAVVDVAADLTVRANADPALRRVLETTNAIRADCAVDRASIIVTDAAGHRWRLPRASDDFDRFPLDLAFDLEEHRAPPVEPIGADPQLEARERLVFLCGVERQVRRVKLQRRDHILRQSARRVVVGLAKRRDELPNLGYASGIHEVFRFVPLGLDRRMTAGPPPHRWAITNSELSVHAKPISRPTRARAQGRSSADAGRRGRGSSSGGPWTSHSRKSVTRWCVSARRTAMASARGLPISTTSRRPRVIAV